MAAASSFSFTGTFLTDDELRIFVFTAPSANVTVRTWSYAGGTNALGQVITAGGFDPELSIFDITGGLSASSILIDTNNDGAGVAIDPVTGSGLDSLLTLTTLSAGSTYALVLSQSGNDPGPDFGSSFPQAGNPTFTSSFGCGGSMFCDITPAQRNGNWAVDITGVRTAVDTSGPTVPEPSPAFLFAAGIGGIALLRRRRRQA
jgi:hypothetical protein